ncbi:T9SS type A sorting domain-containing protein [bacterium]|nr:T9SS type A sorting domain-containing protein [bacterium]
MTKKATIIIMLCAAILLMTPQVFAQSGTFDFDPAFGGGPFPNTVFQTISGVRLDVRATGGADETYRIDASGAGGTTDGVVQGLLSSTPGSMLLFFSASVNITTIRVVDGTSTDYTFTPNTGTPVVASVDNAGATVNLNFIGITSITVSGMYTPYIDNVVMDASLSVGLASFSAHEQGAAVKLNWVSESETDNAGYILERRTQSTEWQTVASYITHAELSGRGNSSQKTEYVFVDEDTKCGGTYEYRLSDVDTEGNVTELDVISITLDPVPAETLLKPAYPNPFNPSTKIQYELAEDVSVTLKVVDIRGRNVQTIVNGEHKSAGSYSVHWNGMNDTGQHAASGVYFLMMQAGQVLKSQKVMLVR